MEYLKQIDYTQAGYGDLWDELPLWSAPFGLLLLERVAFRPEMKVLDVGAGTGFLTLELAARCGRGSEVIAVDPWSAGVARLRKKLEMFDVRNVRLIEQDAARLDLPHASVDLVVSNLGINNFENADAVLDACFRVAKPGASLLMTTNLAGHMAEFYEEFRATLVDLALNDRLGALDEHVARRGTVESVSARLTHAGFELGTVTRRSFALRFADGSAFLRHRLIRLGFIPDWKALLPANQVEPAFSALEKRLNARAAESGDLEMTIPAACFEAVRPQ